jgi:hypothetical protein
VNSKSLSLIFIIGVRINFAPYFLYYTTMQRQEKLMLSLVMALVLIPSNPSATLGKEQ